MRFLITLVILFVSRCVFPPNQETLIAQPWKWLRVSRATLIFVDLRCRDWNKDEQQPPEWRKERWNRKPATDKKRETRVISVTLQLPFHTSPWLSPPPLPLNIAIEVRCYYIEDWIIEQQLPCNGLTSLMIPWPLLETSSTLIRIADMLRGVAPSWSHPDRILSKLLSKDDASWIFISVIRESNVLTRSPLLGVLANDLPCTNSRIPQETHRRSPSKNESISRASAPCVTIGV